VFIANMIGDLSRRQPSLIMAEIKTFQTVFPNSYFFAVDAPERTGLIQNITLVGYNSARHVDVGSPPVTTSPSPLIRFLRYKALDIGHRFELSPYPVLTDTFSPVEYLTARVLERSLVTSAAVNGEEVRAVMRQQLRYEGRRDRVRDFLAAEMNGLAQEVVTPQGTNVIGRLHEDEDRRVLLAAHYDGRGDGAGPALLLELTRTLIVDPSVPRAGVDIALLDASGGSWFAAHLDELYGTQAPVAAVLLDAACRGEVRILTDLAALRETDDPDGPTVDDTLSSCGAGNLEKTARAVLDYVKTRQ